MEDYNFTPLKPAREVATPPGWGYAEQFDPFEAFGVRDDGSPRAVRHAIDGVGMRRALLLNGQLEVWDSESGALLGRSDPYVGMNIDLSATASGLERLATELEAERQRRLASPGPAQSDPAAPPTP